MRAPVIARGVLCPALPAFRRLLRHPPSSTKPSASLVSGPSLVAEARSVQRKGSVKITLTSGQTRREMPFLLSGETSLVSWIACRSPSSSPNSGLI